MNNLNKLLLLSVFCGFAITQPGTASNQSQQGMFEIENSSPDEAVNQEAVQESQVTADVQEVQVPTIDNLEEQHTYVMRPTLLDTANKPMSKVGDYDIQIPVQYIPKDIKSKINIDVKKKSLQDLYDLGFEEKYTIYNANAEYNGYKEQMMFNIETAKNFEEFKNLFIALEKKFNLSVFETEQDEAQHYIYDKQIVIGLSELSEIIRTIIDNISSEENDPSESTDVNELKDKKLRVLLIELAKLTYFTCQILKPLDFFDFNKNQQENRWFLKQAELNIKTLDSFKIENTPIKLHTTNGTIRKNIDINNLYDDLSKTNFKRRIITFSDSDLGF